MVLVTCVYIYHLAQPLSQPIPIIGLDQVVTYIHNFSNFHVLTAALEQNHTVRLLQMFPLHARFSRLQLDYLLHTFHIMTNVPGSIPGT